MKRPLPILLVLLACGACSGGAPSEATGAWTFVETPAGGVTFTLDGVVVEPQPGVLCRYRFATVNGATTTDERTLDGHRFGVRDGVFFVGDREFGPVAAGDVVRVSREGVHVGDERRGDMPAPVE